GGECSVKRGTERKEVIVFGWNIGKRTRFVHGKAEKPKREILCACRIYIVRHTMHRTVSVSIKQPLRLKSLVFFALSVPVLFSQAEIPEWCRALPRPE